MLPSLPKHAVTCLPVAQPGAAVRALRDRFVLMHGLRAAVAEAPATTSFSLTTSPSLSHPLPSSSSSSPSSLSSSSSRYYHAFHIRRQGCDATMADVEAVALQLRNTTAAPAAAPVRAALLIASVPPRPYTSSHLCLSAPVSPRLFPDPSALLAIYLPHATRHVPKDHGVPPPQPQPLLPAGAHAPALHRRTGLALSRCGTRRAGAPLSCHLAA